MWSEKKELKIKQEPGESATEPVPLVPIHSMPSLPALPGVENRECSLEHKKIKRGGFRDNVITVWRCLYSKGRAGRTP